MRRKEFIHKAGLLAAGAAISPLSSLARNKDRLVILHTNDWHSHIEPFPADDKKYPGLGGAAKRSVLIDKIRAQYKNVLLLDSGDIFQGTPYFNYYGGELEFKLMSKMGYDYATLGNHDFDGGLEGFNQQLPHASFKFLCANYDFTDTLLAGKIDSYAIKRKGKFKIGIFGIGIELDGLVPKKLFGNVKYLNPIDKANETAQILKDKGCNLIICLSHLGYSYKSNKVSDTVLAKASSNIDLILGGHTHTFLSSPQAILNQNAKEIFINQTGWAGINLGRVDYETNSPYTSNILEFDYQKIS
ncbi:metallophosphatase [Bacteroidia bacterium]|nr:metallophosphatase [Bacteroidia bacterium]MDC1395556.1 metallophosphatase [Bacteroidia bacterium]